MLVQKNISDNIKNWWVSSLCANMHCNGMAYSIAYPPVFIGMAGFGWQVVSCFYRLS